MSVELKCESCPDSIHPRLTDVSCSSIAKFRAREGDQEKQVSLREFKVKQAVIM